MTELQYKYQSLLEQERSNRANEGIKQQEADVKESQMWSNVKLNEAQVNKLQSETEKIAHEIKLIDANTALTEQQKEKLKAETANGWLNFAVSILDPFGLFRSGNNAVGSAVGSVVGKSAGNALIGA